MRNGWAENRDRKTNAKARISAAYPGFLLRKNGFFVLFRNDNARQLPREEQAELDTEMIWAPILDALFDLLSVQIFFERQFDQ